jgi:hypothetical protein
MFTPLIAVPFWAYSNADWFLLIGIPFAYFGSYSTFSLSLKNFIFLFAFLCIVVWIAWGFSIDQYITSFFFCSLWGYLTALVAQEYEQKKNRRALKYYKAPRESLNRNPDYLQERIRRWTEYNPDKALTWWIIDGLAKGIITPETDYSGRAKSQPIDSSLYDYDIKTPQVLTAKIAEWKRQNPGKQVSETMIETLVRKRRMLCY